MPNAAHHRDGRGPFAALLILFSLLVSSGTAAAAQASGIREPAARLSHGRPGPPTAILHSAARDLRDDLSAGTGGDPLAAAGGAGTVTERLWARPPGDAQPGPAPAPRQAAAAPYRARAPPAA